MKIITLRANDEILAITEKVEIQKETGYPIDVKANIAYPKEMVNVLEVKPSEELEKAKLNRPLRKMCYTESKGFYKNIDWVEPSEYSQAQYDTVILELMEEGVL